MSYDREFALPELVLELVHLQNRLRDHYDRSGLRLKFTPDGRMVGDLGEAIAVELFGVSLKQGRGVDAVAPDGRSVQIKASGTRGGAAFRPIDVAFHAQHLLFFHLDFQGRCGEIVYNGPESNVRREIKLVVGQSTVSARKLRELDSDLPDSKRLVRIDQHAQLS